MVYSDVHRFLLRSVASHGVLTLKDTESILKRFTGKEDLGDLSIKNMVRDINSEIILFQQTIKIVRDEESESNDENLVFLSTGNDDITKSQNLFSEKELEYFRVLLENILMSENQQITIMEALNINNARNLSKKEIESLLEKWCQMHYLKQIEEVIPSTGRSRRNVEIYYTLGLRGVNEFESYMPDRIKKCYLCKANILRIYRTCPSCEETIGKRCLEDYLQRIPKWPCCRREFNVTELNNDSSMETDDMIIEIPDDISSKPSTSKSPATKRRRISYDYRTEEPVASRQHIF